MPLKMIVLAGEASRHPDFLSIVRDVAKAIPGIGVGAAGGKEQHATNKPSVELIVSEDPAFAAALGAALWQRLRIEGSSYCETLECCNSLQIAHRSETAGEMDREL